MSSASRVTRFLHPASLRFQFVAGILGLATLIFVLLSANTVRVLDKMALENLHAAIHHTSGILDLAVAPHTTPNHLHPDGITHLERYLETLVALDEDGVTYIALLDEYGKPLARSRNVPDPLPVPQNDPVELPAGGTAHIAQPVLLGENRIGTLHFGLATRLIRETNRTIMRQNVQLLVIVIGVSLLLILLFALRIDRHFRNLATTVRAIAAGDRSARTDEDGPMEIVRLARDINRMAEAITRSRTELEHERGFLRTLIATIPDLVWLKDPDGLYLACNPRFEQFFGKRIKDIVGRTDYDFVDRKLADFFRDHDRMAMENNGPTINEEWATFAADGHRELLETTKVPMRDAQGKLVGVLGIGHDITRRKQLQVELQESETRFRSLFEDAPDGIVTVDYVSRRIVDVNMTICTMLGYTREEMLGLGVDDLHPPADLSRVMGAFERQARGEIRLAQNQPVIRKNGTVFPADISVARLTVGDRTYMAGFFRDSTERVRAERELELHRQHLERLVAERTAELESANLQAKIASQAKSEFLANMSHEIRTPLNAILGLTHLLHRETINVRVAERLDKIDAAGHHLLSVINDILDLSKIEAGKLVLETRDFTPADTLGHVRGLIDEAARAKGLAMVTETDPAPLWLRGDTTRLQQALLNFASNAVKFTEAGSITLRARVVEQDDARVLIRFEVQDTGIGIEPATIARLFNAFEQGDASTTRQHGGTGLGLAITQSIARLMGGDAGVDSVPGQGSLFWFTARLERGQPGALPDIVVTDAGEVLRQRHAGARLLLVEDNPINREVALDLLHDVGLSADTAANGRIAVDKVSSRDYDLVLMDMQMPEMDGLEATHRIRALPGRAALPILAMTANAFAEDRRNCEAAGMNDFVAKPVDPAALYATLLKWLPEKSAAPAKEVGAGGTASSSAAAADTATKAAIARLAAAAEIDMEQAIEVVRGRPAKLVAYLRELVASHHDDMLQVQACLAQGDRENARRTVHTLKGVAGNLGARGLAGAARQLDAVLREPATDGEAVRIGVLVDAVDRQMLRLAGLLEDPPPA
ncbi:MAG: PAS domain S-box protein [Rhodocyclaceae bacterium]|jgi:PAS domain S-box-containing protein|nr:PAS domain S-box protein [Rhodocyclaceae bacterium]